MKFCYLLLMIQIADFDYICLFPKWFAFPSLWEAKCIQIYLWIIRKKRLYFLEHIIVWRDDIQEILDDTYIIVYTKWIRLKCNPWMSHLLGDIGRIVFCLFHIREWWQHVFLVRVTMVSQDSKGAICSPNDWEIFFLIFLVLDVVVYVCDDSKWKYLWKNPCWWVWVRICFLKMDDEVLFWFVKLLIY